MLSEPPGSCRGTERGRRLRWGTGAAGSADGPRPRGCGGDADAGEAPKQAGAGPEQRGFNLNFFFAICLYKKKKNHLTKPHFGADPTPLLRRPGRARGPDPPPPPPILFGSLIVLGFIAFLAEGSGPGLPLVLLHPSAHGEEPEGGGGCVIPSPPRSAGAGRVQRVCA